MMKYFQTHLKSKSCFLFTLYCIIFAHPTIQINFKPSPCPATFSYEQGEPEDDRWYGDITLKINKTVDGSTFRIGLDRPSQLLVSWAGAAISTDNKIYIITHDDAVLDKGSTYKLRIMIKFDKNDVIPMLESIHFNSRRICPPDSVALSGKGTESSNSRPDIEVSEPTDVISDIDKRPNNPSRPSTTKQPSGNVNSNNGNSNTNSGNSNSFKPNTNKNPETSSSNNFSNLNQEFNSGTTNNFGNSGSSNFNNFNEGNSNSNNFNGGSSGNFNQGNAGSLNENSGNKGTHSSCGSVSIANPLVTNGQKTQHGQWPWHIALYKTEGINLSYICGGSLVTKNKVITAAHCLFSIPGNKIVNPKSLIVYLGKYNLRQYTDETGVQTKEVARLNVNPSYNSTNFHGDIAILTLSSDVEITNYVRPVCVWESSDGIEDVVNTEGTVPGWGFDEHEQTSEELKTATLPVVSTEKCFRSYPKFYSEYLSETAFCAGFRNGTSPCNGDSGGGLAIKRGSTWYLRGIVSLSVAREGLNFCDPSYYVIFTDVARYADFINKNTYSG